MEGCTKDAGKIMNMTYNNYIPIVWTSLRYSNHTQEFSFGRGLPQCVAHIEHANVQGPEGVGGGGWGEFYWLLLATTLLLALLTVANFPFSILVCGCGQCVCVGAGGDQGDYNSNESLGGWSYCEILCCPVGIIRTISSWEGGRIFSVIILLCSPNKSHSF